MTKYQCLQYVLDRPGVLTAVFTPKHPRTKPKLEELEEAEKALDIDGLVDEAVSNIERVMLDL